jgi:hypothetical protein
MDSGFYSSFFFFAGKASGQRAQGMMWSVVSLVVSVFLMILLVAKRSFSMRKSPRVRNFSSIESTHAHTPANFEGPLVYNTVPPGSQPSISPDGVMTSISRSPWVTTAGHIRSVMSGSRLLFYYGRGYYDDEAGNRYPIKFCYLLGSGFSQKHAHFSKPILP